MSLALKGLQKASPEAKEIMAGRAKIDFHKECLMACKVCGITTVHEKLRRKASKTETQLYYTKVRKCKECGNEVAF